MWNINWIAMVVAAVAGFMVGGLWYGPLFGKKWQAESGLTDAAMKSANMARIFGLTFLLNLVASFILGHVLATYNHPPLGLSVMIGGGIGLGFVATSIGVNYLFARKSLNLFLIDAAYWVIIYAVMGAVFGLFTGH
ncbi:MAG: hypothetical protein RL367_1129 [Pseudomonadota bacterium]|jgi:hypothetical protein